MSIDERGLPPASAPAVIVPVLGATAAELLAQAATLAERRADVVEWRVDHLGEGSLTPEAVAALATDLATTLVGRPLLATVRTTVEGGAAELDDEQYARILEALAASGAVDLLDVEHSRDAAIVSRLVAAAHEAAVPVVLSSHDMAATPPAETMLARLRAMQDQGADLVKLAVTPRDRRDVAALLQATADFSEGPATVPAITMAMGELGVVTRLAGHLFGSTATFASAGTASAPGQPDLDLLRDVLDAVGRATR